MSVDVSTRRVLVTGADGFLGRGLLQALTREPGVRAIVAADIRDVPQERRLPGVTYLRQDVRDPAVAETLRAHAIDSVSPDRQHEQLRQHWGHQQHRL